jgi:hypothetical protein
MKRTVTGAPGGRLPVMFVIFGGENHAFSSAIRIGQAS